MDTYPTYLYIKRHRKTGLKYLGKTTKTNIESYRGSGLYWTRHIKKHGLKDVETFWVSEPFYNHELLKEFATFISEFFDVENSFEWANLMIENGLDGAPKGVKNSGPRGEKNGMYGKKGELNPFYGKKHLTELKKKWREERLGEKNPNFGAKAFTEETYNKLRKPKPPGSNYRGSPGKITCINKSGVAIQIDKKIYNDQKLSVLPECEWEYVNTNSKQAKIRKIDASHNKST